MTKNGLQYRLKEKEIRPLLADELTSSPLRDKNLDSVFFNNSHAELTEARRKR